MKSVLIAGHGRSGTNWLLDILDQSSTTFCANERNRIGQALMSELPDPSVDCGQYAGLEDVWGWVVNETKHRFGERDPVSQSKNFLYSGLRGKLLYVIRTRQRLRALASFFSEPLSGPEWPAPRPLVRKNELDNALLILKINQCPALACWLLRRFPNEAVVVHILRHPGGALNSWQRRFLDGKNEAIVNVNNRNRLESIIAMDKVINTNTKTKITEYLNKNEDDIFYSEGLYWLYANERIYECGSKMNHSAASGGESDPTTLNNYIFINYEMLCKDPETIARNVYSRLDLAWDENVMEKISERSKNSIDISEKWRKFLPRENQIMAESILEGSLFEKMWSQDQDPAPAKVDRAEIPVG